MEKIIISLAESMKERNEAYEYMRKQIFETYGNYPSPLEPEMKLLLAKRKGLIIGTIGFYTDIDSKLLPHERICDLVGIKIYEGKRAFISRWVSTENFIGLFLTYCVCKYLVSMGVLHGFCFLKPKVGNYIAELIPDTWRLIQEAKIISSKVPKEDRNYFLSEPKPNLYVGDLDKHVQILSGNSFVQKIIDKSEIKFS